MSSDYLTSNDLNMIERLLGEVREPGNFRGLDRESVAARFLIANFRRSKTAEKDLRTLLAARIKAQDATERGLNRWDNEGGAPAKRVRTEAQRRIDNDTDGTRRRARGTEQRNQLI